MRMRRLRLRPRAAAVLVAAVTACTAAGPTAAHHASDTTPTAVPASSPRAVAASSAPTPPPRRITRVVVLGDSVVSGTACGCTPFGPRLARLLTRATAHRVDVISLGQDGLTSAGLVTQLEHDAPSRAALRRATTVSVTIGANDFDESDADDGCGGNGTSCYDDALRALSSRLGATLELVHALAGPHVDVLLTGYWNVFLDGAVGASHGPTYQRTSDTLTRLVNQRIAAAAAAAGATYVDLYGAFGSDDTRLLAPDGDHPDAAGHELIARVLATTIERR